MASEILTFERDMHFALWGSESWEVSVHPSAPGTVARGEAKGRKFPELAGNFGLLIKVIDAKDRLSVQVHPNETTCLATGGDPKSEMWCLLDDGLIFAGLRKGVTSVDVEEAVHSGVFEDLLVRHEAKKGDAFYIPGGLVHAIGEGTIIYEVQQSSDTTFRLYDWNRTGPDGKRRELHVEKALKAIDYSLEPPARQRDIASPFFGFRQVEIGGEAEIPAQSAVYVAEGEIELGGVRLAKGASAFVRGEESAAAKGDGMIFVTQDTKQGMENSQP